MTCLLLGVHLAFVGGYFCVASCMSWTDMYDGVSVTAMMLSFMPSMSSALFSVWFCLNSQSGLYR